VPALCKGRHILRILGQKQLHRLIDQIRHRFIRLRRFNPQGMVQVSVKINGGPFLCSFHN
jgi:hypothetical protein